MDVRDRRCWRHWLFEASKRYGLTVLNYIATSNHIHLLCFDQGRSEIARSMQLVAGRTAQEFNTRNNRKGAFWEGRYHATAVQTDGHLLSCMTYIDLNMVRAGAVSHPSQWEVSGYNEIQSTLRRKRIIDSDTLRRLLGVASSQALRTVLDGSLNERILETRRESRWTEPIAVGDRAFLAQLDRDLGVRLLGRRITRDSDSWSLREAAKPYPATAKPPKPGPISE